jgi:hypothetical protein
VALELNVPKSNPLTSPIFHGDGKTADEVCEVLRSYIGDSLVSATISVEYHEMFNQPIKYGVRLMAITYDPPIQKFEKTTPWWEPF